jgi:TRAP transporter TAXI family solute receptor
MPEALTVVAGRDTGIRTGSDLFGRRVNLGQYGSGTFVLRELLGTIDPRVNTIQAFPDLKTALSADALCRRSIDAFAFVAGYPNPLVQQATAECGAYLVPVTGEGISTLIDTYPFYSRITIPGGIYRNNPADVSTIGVHATLVTREDVPADLVYRLTKALYEGLGEFRRLHLAFARFDQNSLAAACNTAPLHEGAARYLREAGIEQPPCPQ